MPSRPVLIGRGLVLQTLNNHNNTCKAMFASTNPEHTQDTHLNSGLDVHHP